MGRRDKQLRAAKKDGLKTTQKAGFTAQRQEGRRLNPSMIKNVLALPQKKCNEFKIFMLLNHNEPINKGEDSISVHEDNVWCAIAIFRDIPEKLYERTYSIPELDGSITMNFVLSNKTIQNGNERQIVIEVNVDTKKDQIRISKNINGSSEELARIPIKHSLKEILKILENANKSLF